MKQQIVLKNTYFDSVTLMRTASDLKKSLELKELILLMGTDMNKEMIQSVGLFHASFEDATPNDLLIAAHLNHEIAHFKDQILESLSHQKTATTTNQTEFKTLNQAYEAMTPNMAVISVPGIYAAFEAYKALEKNMHVMMFSDNVSIEDEIKLKDIAIQKDLLMMGPDCGTAIINGVGLCFANKVKRGSIGIIAASGTGLQEVSCIIDRFGGGISQAIGVGGRDLSKEVGGRMMLHALNALNHDDETKIIVIISKPPHQDVITKLVDQLKTIQKPVVLGLLDAKLNLNLKHVYPTDTLTSTAFKALELINLKHENLLRLTDDEESFIQSERKKYIQAQKYVKALYCGGTLASEALSLLRPNVSHLQSNVAKIEEEKLHDLNESFGHLILDLGDDDFTKGKPHPMIEPEIRNERLFKEAKNPETRVILLDFELGFGAHQDPVSVSVETIKDAQKLAQKEGRHVTFVAHVLGTKNDPQNLDQQIKQLTNLGVVVAESNAHAALIAAMLVKEV